MSTFQLSQTVRQSRPAGLALIAGLTVTLLAPLSALAHPDDCGPMAGPYMENMRGDRAERMQMRQTQLHDALKLTPEQEGAWKKYAESMRPPAAAAQRSDDWRKMSMPERGEKMLELSQQHQERMREHVAAMKALYATLTPEQRKVFDSHHAERRGPRSNQRPPAPTEPNKG